MGGFSIWHWLIVLVVVLLLFGKGKVPALMGDLAKGVKAFKKGMADDEPAAPTPGASEAPKVLTAEPKEPVPGAERNDAAKH